MGIIRKDIWVFPIFFISICLFFLGACSNKEIVICTPLPKADTGVYTLSLNTSKGIATRALVLDGNTLSSSWLTTEYVYVKKGDSWAIGSLSPESNSSKSKLKGEISSIQIEKGDELFLQYPKSGSITYEGQLGTISDIAMNYDYASASVYVESIIEGNINVSGVTVFSNQQAIVKFTLRDVDGSILPENPSSITVSYGSGVVVVADIPEETYTANGPGVLYVAIPGFTSQTVSITAAVGTNIYTYEKPNVSFDNGHFYSITIKLNKSIMGGQDISEVFFPEAPVEIFNNEDHGMQLINYFNIIQVSNDLYYLYYSGFPNDNTGEFDQNLYLATSTDGLHYTDYYFEGNNRIIMEGIKEQFVLYTPEEESKFKLVGNIKEDEVVKLCVWDSNDGIHFDNRTIVLATIPHDTQNVLICRDGGYDLYTRLWTPDWEHRTNRRIAKCHLNADYSVGSELEVLNPNYMYTNAATKLDEEYDILFPTFFNDIEREGNQECYFEIFICKGDSLTRINSNINDYRDYNLEKWVMMAPGIITIGKHQYIAYMSKDIEHSGGKNKETVSKYKVLKIKYK